MKKRSIVATFILIGMIVTAGILSMGWGGFLTLPQLELSEPTPPAPTEVPQPPAQDDSMLRVSAPLSGAIVASPLHVTGEARGNWFFEASFPVRILDANGMELGVVPAVALGEWMTTEFVSFQATLVFATSTTDTGFLILEKDNPSGLPEHADERRIPVRFR